MYVPMLLKFKNELAPDLCENGCVGESEQRKDRGVLWSSKEIKTVGPGDEL